MENLTMKLARLIYSPSVICLLIIGSLTTGCASHREFVINFTADKYQQLDKYPIRVRLEYGNDYQMAKGKGALNQVLIGPELVRNTTNLAKHMFQLVDDSTSEGSNPRYDALLTAEVISINSQIKMWAGQVSKTSVTHKWTLKDASNNTIWVQSITGVGIMESGTAFSESTRGKERALLAVDDLFMKSAEAMSSSFEIRNFSERLSVANN